MTPETPVSYAVSYSERAREHLRRLGAAARDRGDGEAFVHALREFHRRLCIFPQFGDPLSDLRIEAGQVRIGVVAPLVMRYGVYEDSRMVFVGALPELLSARRPGGLV